MLAAGFYQVTFPVAMANTNYYVNAFALTKNTAATGHAMMSSSARTTTGMLLLAGQYGSAGNASSQDYTMSWEVKGIHA